MSMVSFYVSNENYDCLNEFKTKYGKSWNKVIMNFIISDIEKDKHEMSVSESKAKLVFEKSFSEISNEDDFRELYKHNNTVVFKIINDKMQEIYEQYPELYPDVLKMFLNKYPKLSKIAKLAGANYR